MDTAKQFACDTIEDIYNLPEGQRAELIDGEMYMMAAPDRIHQKLVSQFTQIIGQYIKSHHGGCEVYPAPFAVFLNNDNQNYFEPDLCVICDPSKLDEKGCHGAPDWVIEVVSQSSRQMDYFRKLFKYRSAGVREYWIVDPMKQQIMVYNFEHDAFEEYSFSDKVKAGIFGDFEIDFAGIHVE